MNRLLSFAATCAFSMALISAAPTDDKAAVSKASAQAQFEQLKKLAGEWSGKAGHDGAEFDATVTYRVTSAGSTVMETLFGGTDHEMITMYHLNNDSLILTHYCALGNQPRMKAAISDDPKKMAFKFLDGTNLNPTKDPHMHEATIELVDNNHIRSAWTSYNEGKPMSTAKFDLKRKEAAAK
jgi:hypothetical protein